MQTIVTAAFNLLEDGSILMQGDHAPGVSGPKKFGELCIETCRIGCGHYEVRAPSIALPDGWKATIYRDENDEPTLRLQLQEREGVLTVLATDPVGGEPKDIVHMLTLRVAVPSG